MGREPYSIDSGFTLRIWTEPFLGAWGGMLPSVQKWALGTLAECLYLALILDAERGPSKDSCLALGPEDRKALPQPVPRHPLPNLAARNQESSGQPQAPALARQVSWWYSRKKKKKKKFKQSSIPQFSFKSVGRQAQFSDHQEQKLWLQSKWKKKTKRISTYNMKIQKIHQRKKTIKVYFQQNWGSAAFSAFNA